MAPELLMIMVRRERDQENIRKYRLESPSVGVLGPDLPITLRSDRAWGEVERKLGEFHQPCWTAFSRKALSIEGVVVLLFGRTEVVVIKDTAADWEDIQPKIRESFEQAFQVVVSFLSGDYDYFSGRGQWGGPFSLN